MLHASAQASLNHNALLWEVLMAGDFLEIVIDTPGPSGQTHSFCLLPGMTRDKKKSQKIPQESDCPACDEKIQSHVTFPLIHSFPLGDLHSHHGECLLWAGPHDGLSLGTQQ